MKNYAQKEEYFNEGSLPLFAQRLIELYNQDGKELHFQPDINKVALLVCDLQKYFFLPASNAYIPSTKYIIPKIKQLISFFKENQQPVIFTRHFNNTDNAGMMSKKWNKLIDKDTDYFNIIDELDTTSCLIIDKTRYDAFHNTGLNDILTDRNITQIVITGVMTHLCCESTVRSAFMNDFEAFFPVDATATYNELFHTSSFTNLCHGFIDAVTTGQLIRELENG